MTLAGFAAFLDPPKQGIPAVLEELQRNGVSVVIMTGDNQYVAQKIAQDVGLKMDRIVIGDQVDTMDDAALAVQAENGAIFARVSPEQKNRVIMAQKHADMWWGISATGSTMLRRYIPRTSAFRS